MNTTTPQPQTNQTPQPTWLDNAIMGRGLLGSAFSVGAGLYCATGFVTEIAVGVVSDKGADRVHQAFFGKDL